MSKPTENNIQEELSPNEETKQKESDLRSIVNVNLKDKSDIINR